MVRSDFCAICAKEGVDLGGIDQVVGVAKFVLPLRAAVSFKGVIAEESSISGSGTGQADFDERIPKCLGIRRHFIRSTYMAPTWTYMRSSCAYVAGMNRA